MMSLNNEKPNTPGSVFFAHGQESGPWGTKIRMMADAAAKRGFTVESPDYSGMMDADARVEKLLSLNPESTGKLVLVGSSMGAWVSLKASARIHPQGLFLLAPAVYVGAYSEEAPPPKAEHCIVVHGWNDDVVPVDNVLRFARKHEVELHLLKSGHRLTDQMQTLEMLFGHFLERLCVIPEEDPRSDWEKELESRYQRQTFLNQKPRIPQ